MKTLADLAKDAREHARREIEKQRREAEAAHRERLRELLAKLWADENAYPNAVPHDSEGE